MWPFGRRRREPARASRGEVFTPPAPALHLPPLARTVGTPVLTMGTSAFEADLASRRVPQPFLGLRPLAHQVSPSAPGGSVAGLALPSPGPLRGGENGDIGQLPVAPGPVQRLAVHGRPAVPGRPLTRAAGVVPPARPLPALAGPPPPSLRGVAAAAEADGPVPRTAADGAVTIEAPASERGADQPPVLSTADLLGVDPSAGSPDARSLPSADGGTAPVPEAAEDLPRPLPLRTPPPPGAGAAAPDGDGEPPGPASPRGLAALTSLIWSRRQRAGEDGGHVGDAHVQRSGAGAALPARPADGAGRGLLRPSGDGGRRARSLPPAGTAPGDSGGGRGGPDAPTAAVLPLPLARTSGDGGAEGGGSNVAALRSLPLAGASGDRAGEGGGSNVAALRSLPAPGTSGDGGGEGGGPNVAALRSLPLVGASAVPAGSAGAGAKPIDPGREGAGATPLAGRSAGDQASPVPDRAPGPAVQRETVSAPPPGTVPAGPGVGSHDPAPAARAPEGAGVGGQESEGDRPLLAVEGLDLVPPGAGDADPAAAAPAAERDSPAPLAPLPLAARRAGSPEPAVAGSQPDEQGDLPVQRIVDGGAAPAVTPGAHGAGDLRQGGDPERTTLGNTTDEAGASPPPRSAAAPRLGLGQPIAWPPHGLEPPPVRPAATGASDSGRGSGASAPPPARGVGLGAPLTLRSGVQRAVADGPTPASPPGRPPSAPHAPPVQRRAAHPGTADAPHGLVGAPLAPDPASGADASLLGGPLYDRAGAALPGEAAAGPHGRGTAPGPLPGLPVAGQPRGDETAHPARPLTAGVHPGTRDAAALAPLLTRSSHELDAGLLGGGPGAGPADDPDAGLLGGRAISDATGGTAITEAGGSPATGSVMGPDAGLVGGPAPAVPGGDAAGRMLGALRLPESRRPAGRVGPEAAPDPSPVQREGGPGRSQAIHGRLPVQRDSRPGRPLPVAPLLASVPRLGALPPAAPRAADGGAAAGAAPASAGRGSSGLAGPAAAPATGGRDGWGVSGLPTPALPVQRAATPAAADPMAAALANGLGHVAADGSLVFQRLADPDPAPPPPPPPAPAAEPPTGTTSAVSTAPPAPGPAGRDDLDELARRLYDRIRGRLKAELHLDRERAGLAIDLRR